MDDGHRQLCCYEPVPHRASRHHDTTVALIYLALFYPRYWSVPMYSLRTQEKLDAARDQTSSREILWRNLRNKKKSGRMVRRIYNKSREEMVHSCRSRCREWIARANEDMGNWVREPQPSAFQHTFRDRQPEAELGPANGHVSGRKYVPRLVLCGGGELDKKKTADLAETLLEPSRMRGNDPNALQNPCRPSVVITDTAKIRGRIEHPHWEPPRYFLRPREKAQEIGPDIQYADRNDTQRIFSGVVKNSLFAWGKYEGGGPTDAPTCRHEQRGKWMGDQPFYPGFRYADNQRETISGTKYPPDLLTAGNFTRAVDFSRDRHPDKELPQHERFQLVVRSGEYACPDGNTRRSLRFVEEPPDPYQEGKTYFASIRSVPATAATGNMANLPPTTRPRLGRLSESNSVGSLCGRGGRTQKTCQGGGVSRGEALQSSGDGSSSRLLSSSKSSTGVRFSPGYDQAGLPDKEGECDEGPRRAMVVKVGPDTTQRSSRAGFDAKVVSGMRRGSEMASWATCGAREKSARDYLW